MKKIVLSIMALLAIVLNVKAAEPTYTAKGTVGVVPSDWAEAGYSALISGIEADVEVYGSDSIVIRKWAGAEGGDLVVELGTDGNVGNTYCYYISDKGTSYKYSYPYGDYYYVYTGLNDSPYGLYFYNAAGYSSYESDETTKSGSMILSVYAAYDSKNNALSGAFAYFIAWSNSSTGIKSIAAETATESECYNLAGQRVSKDAKGLIIKNGKKYLNK